MIRDRGIIKFQPAHFMPEHRKLLYKLTVDGNKQSKPELDEQEFEEIGFVVMDSLDSTIPIRITIWQNGFLKSITGIVTKVDLLMKYIVFETGNKQRTLKVEEITAAERV